MKKSFVLHTGLPKTATSTLQKSIFPQMEGINYCGIYEWNYFKNPPTHQQMIKLTKAIHDGRADDGKKMMESFSKDTINVFSNEAWYTKNMFNKEDDRFELAETIKKIFPGAKIIIGLRNIESAKKSWYKQYIHCGGTEDYGIYKKKHLNVDLLDGKKYEEYMTSLFGKTKVFSYTFEDIIKDQQTVYGKIATFIGSPTKNFVVFSKNIGYSKNQLKIAIMLNNLFKTKINKKGIMPWRHILPHRAVFQTWNSLLTKK